MTVIGVKDNTLRIVQPEAIRIKVRDLIVDAIEESVRPGIDAINFPIEAIGDIENASGIGYALWIIATKTGSIK